MSMKPHLRRAHEAMERVGIRILDLEAGLQSGPTFWARAGVDFRHGRALLDHLELLAMLLAGASTAPGFTTPEDVRMAFPGQTASIERAHSLSLALSLAASAPVWVINPLNFLENDLGILIDVQRPIGEAILEPSMSVNTNVTVPDGCTLTDESSAASNGGTSRHPHASGVAACQRRLRDPHRAPDRQRRRCCWCVLSARARPEIVADTANDPCERYANIRRSTRVHARVTSVRRILLVCGAFVPAVTRACLRIPAWFQDGKEGVDGSSPSEGSAKAPEIGALSFTISCVRRVWSRLWSFQEAPLRMAEAPRRQTCSLYTSRSSPSQYSRCSMRPVTPRPRKKTLRERGW